jgi:hypothetical protein
MPAPAPAPPAGAAGGAGSPGPSLRASIIVVATGVIPLLVGTIGGGVVLFRAVTTGQSISVPGAATLTLDSGTHLVYERTGTRSGGAGITFTNNSAVTIGAEDVNVTDPSGEPIPVREASGGIETITRDSRIYTGAVEFDVPSHGRYRVEVLAGRGGEALVAKSVGDSFERALPWIGVAVLGGLVAGVGLVMLIVGSVRRGAARRRGFSAYPALR